MAWKWRTECEDSKVTEEFRVTANGNKGGNGKLNTAGHLKQCHSKNESRY